MCVCVCVCGMQRTQAPHWAEWKRAMPADRAGRTGRSADLQLSAGEICTAETGWAAPGERTGNEHRGWSRGKEEEEEESLTIASRGEEEEDHRDRES